MQPVSVPRGGRAGLFCLFLGSMAAQTPTEFFQGHEVASRTLIVKFKAGSLPDLTQAIHAHDLDRAEALTKNRDLFLFHSRSKSFSRLLSDVAASLAIAYVEPDYIIRVRAVPNDPSFPQQWGFLNSARAGADIGATAAWNISTGSAANVAGVVDTGIDYTHPDLTPNVWSAPSSFTVNLAGVSISCPAGSHGFNAITNTCDPMDDNNHGTHVAGTIGAASNNGAGVAGVNWTTRIMGLKFIAANGSGDLANAIKAIEFAIQVKAQFAGTSTPVNIRVLSNSWGGGGFSQSLLDQVNKANANDMLFVAAAGNSGSNNDATPFYPAGFNAPNIVSVAATDSSDNLAGFSNYGPSSVHLGAPGDSILSTVPGGGYAFFSGTSMATPHVAGAAMLVLSACSLSTASLKANLLSNVDVIGPLSGKTITGGRLNVGRAIQACSGGKGAKVTFLGLDSSTQGNWKSKYGGDGYAIMDDSARNPSYATVTPSGNSDWVWSTSTSDVRAVQKAAAGDRIASTWYSFSTFSVDLIIGDTAPHQVAMYFLDWDYAGRAETVDVVDAATNAILDSRSVSNFTGGVYLVWSITGHVTLRFTRTSGINAVTSGVFFGAGAALASASANFVSTDTSTQGNWKSRYGSDGYVVVDDSARNPSYATVTPSGYSDYIWNGSTTDPRALQKAAATDRLAATWYSPSSFLVDLNLTDSAPHQVAVYCLDWDYGGRAQTVDVLDAATNTVLDSRSLSGFTSGVYLVWNIAGHVKLRFTHLGGYNAVAGAVLFGGAANSSTGAGAAFAGLDTATQGNWKTRYGADGYIVVDDSSVNPSYATLAPSGASDYIWLASTADTRGLQKGSASDRIAATWYSPSVFFVDLNITDAQAHPVAVYCVDWYWQGRAQTIDVLDAATNAVLDTRSISDFGNGVYLVWNLSGHVKLRIAQSAGPNGIVSGVFFR